MAWLESKASLPPRRMTALPLLRHRAAASEVTLTGATYGDKQNIVIIEVDARQMSAGYTHLSLNASKTTSTACLSSCVMLPHELRWQRKPSGLWNLLRPGVANA